MKLPDRRPEPLALRSVTTRGVMLPLRFELGTSAAVISSVPLLLVDLLTEAGVVGRAYVFGYSPSGARAMAGHLAEAVEWLKGQPISPLGAAEALGRRYRLLGVDGTVRMALAALDIALWDAFAVSLGLPLATVLGAAPRPLPAYDSRGLGRMAPERLAAEAEALLASGLKAVKLRVGYSTLAEDLAALRAVQGRVPAGTAIMVDYNQALTATEAISRGRALQQEGIVWLEEPIRHDDHRGNAAIARALDVPLQLGENFNGPEGMAQALASGACDYVMPDVARIGGVTGWMRAAGLAAAHGVEMSSHLMPEISVHLLAATSRAHWLEYVDWADAILEQPLELSDGNAVTPDRPGLGMVWDEARIKRLEAL